MLQHKLREAMAAELKGRIVGGEGKAVEVDGGYFGGYVKPANLREDRRDRRFSRNKSGKRQVVVIVRERNGNGVPAVFKSEAQAYKFIAARVAKGSVVNADEANSWERLHERFEVKRINHQEAYSLDGACTELGGGDDFSAACGARKLAITTISPDKSLASLCTGSKRGGKITAVSQTASK